MTNRSNSGVPARVAVVITAAGSSTRMGGSVKKEYLPLGNGTVLSACVKAFQTASQTSNPLFVLSNLIITIPQNGQEAVANALAGLGNTEIDFVTGGSTRQSSVLNALEHLKKSPIQSDYVFIHDGARPFVTQQIIESVLNGVQECGAAAPGITPTDTIKAIDENGFISAHLERKSLTAIQTPQGFEFSRLYEAHTKAAADGHSYTDDSEIWDKYCGKVKLVPGDSKNIKITYPGDLERAKGGSL